MRMLTIWWIYPAPEERDAPSGYVRTHIDVWSMKNAARLGCSDGGRSTLLMNVYISRPTSTSSWKKQKDEITCNRSIHNLEAATPGNAGTTKSKTKSEGSCGGLKGSKSAENASSSSLEGDGGRRGGGLSWAFLRII